MDTSRLRKRIFYASILLNGLLVLILIFQSWNSPRADYTLALWRWFSWSIIPIYILLCLSYFVFDPVRLFSSSKGNFIFALYIIYYLALFTIPIYAAEKTSPEELDGVIRFLNEPGYYTYYTTGLILVSIQPLLIAPGAIKISNIGQTSTIKVFISYSHIDQEYMNRLDKHLSILKRQNELESWDDRCIDPGENWKDKIHDAVFSTHVFLLLISADFLASDYCNDVELAEASKRASKGECIIIPIILKNCDWKNYKMIEKLKVLPKDGRAIVNWDDEDSAYLDIVTGIRRILSKYNN